jgi:hypothetical protein
MPLSYSGADIKGRLDGQEISLTVNGDFALQGELDSVAHQLGENLAHTDRVATDQSRNCGIGDTEQLQSLLLRLQGEGRPNIIQQALEAEIHCRKVELPRLDLGEVDLVPIRRIALPEAARFTTARARM